MGFFSRQFFSYNVILMEPETPWKLDPSVLAEKNSHGVSEEVLAKKVAQFKPILSLYFAWFVNRLDSGDILEIGLKWLERCLTTCQEFNKDFRYIVFSDNQEAWSFRDFDK